MSKREPHPHPASPHCMLLRLPSVRALLLLPLLTLPLACRGEGSSTSTEATGPRLAFVTNGVDPFWTLASAGVQAGNAEFEASCEVRMPKDVVDQKGILQDLLAKEIEGIAISPIDAINQISTINEAAARTNLITTDSDSPDSDRLCFVGVDNYEAGRLAGQLVREALPDGGSIIIFVGRMEQDNARLRRLGLIDAVLGVDRDPQREYPGGEVVEGDGYRILDTRTDLFDYAKAKSNAEDALARYDDLDCMVGLFAYNAPNILEALRGADKLGQVKVVSFDEQEATLQGMLDGHIVGTVVQDPYEYGRQSVRILAGLARDDSSVLPEGGILDVPAKILRPADAQAFWDEMRRRLEAGAQGGQ